MSTIKIKFQRDVEVDLNHYFPQFNKKLQVEITDAVWALASGTKPAKPEKSNKSDVPKFRRWKHQGDGACLTDPSRVCWLAGDKNKPKYGTSLKLWITLWKKFGTEKMTMEDVLKCAEVEVSLSKKDSQSAIASFWAQGFIEIEHGKI